MIKRILGYVLVFFITLYFFFMYDDEVVKALVAVEVIYFAVSMVYLIVIKGKMSASMVSRSLIAEKNKEISITFRVINKSICPWVNICAVFKVENLYTGEKKRYRHNGYVGREENKVMIVPLRIKECGNIKVTLEKVEVFDALFILKVGKKIAESSYIGVLPECHLMPIEITRRTREFIADADEYSDKEKGDDSSEIYQIREYREGDSIHNIHWKMTAKEDEIMVKENSKPLAASVLIWLNMEKNQKYSGQNTIAFLRNKDENRKQISNMFEMVASVSLSLLEDKCVHMVAWYEEKNKKIRCKRISREEHIYELLYRLLFVESYNKSDDVRIQFEDAFRGIEFSTTIELQLDGNVFVGDEKIDVPIKKDEVVWEQVYMKV